MKRLLGMGILFGLIFTSCLNYEETLSINADGSAKIVVEYSMDESIMGMGGTNDLPMKMDKESIVKEIGEGSGIEVLAIETNSTNGKFVVKTTATIKNINTVSNVWVLKDRMMNFSATESAVRFTMVLSNESAGNDQEQDEATKKMMQSMFADNKFVYRIVMPSEITEFSPTNAVMKDNTITWEIPMLSYMEMKTLELSIVAKGASPSIPILWVIIGIAVLLVIGIIIVVIKKK